MTAFTVQLFDGVWQVFHLWIVVTWNRVHFLKVLSPRIATELLLFLLLASILGKKEGRREELGAFVKNLAYP